MRLIREGFVAGRARPLWGSEPASLDRVLGDSLSKFLWMQAL